MFSMVWRGVWKELNEFFSSTSIHGFPYISSTQATSTRIIWTIIVSLALGGASFFLYETVKGFDDKYISTTIETRSIQEFPFPAVTFHPGDFNSRNAFKRTFLNELEFTRYDKSSPLRDNGPFTKTYHWLISPMKNKLFDDIEKFLNEQKPEGGHKTFIQSKERIFKNEICSLVALKHCRKVSLKEDIRDIFASNMYKFRQFNDLKNVIKKLVAPIIKDAENKTNLTKSDIKTACNDERNKDLKIQISAMLLSYMYIFIDWKSTEVGAGDLATGPYETGLTRGKYHIPFTQYYVDTQTLLTSMYNVMVNGSLPISIFEFPTFFTLLDEDLKVSGKADEFLVNINRLIELIDISDETIRNYHYYWSTYNSFKNNFTLFCHDDKNINCSTDLLRYTLAESPKHFDGVTGLHRNPSLGKLVESKVSCPPCTSKDIVHDLKLEPICDFLKLISNSKESFLKLMKFTKQSPTYTEDDEEHNSIFKRDSIALFGFNSTSNKVSMKCFFFLCFHIFIL